MKEEHITDKEMNTPEKGWKKRLSKLSPTAQKDDTALQLAKHFYFRGWYDGWMASMHESLRIVKGTKP